MDVTQAGGVRFSAASPPLISVIVVNHNRRSLLQSCLASLERQTFQNFERIVVDNGSEDGSAQWLEGGGAGADRVLLNRENRGFCGANNQGILASRGRYVALLNNDAEAHPEWLSELARVAEADARVGMVASKVLRFDDPETIDKAGHLIYPDGQNRGRGSGQRDIGQFDQEEEVAWPDGCAALYRRQMLNEIGGFDEDFFAYAEDAELGLRARIAGWRCVYAPRAVVYHRLGSTLGRFSERRLFLIERNRIWLVAKLFPLRLWAMAPLFYGMRLAATALALRRGLGEASLARAQLGRWRLVKCLVSANWAALRGLPRVLRKRRRLSRIRKLSSAEVARLLRRFRIPLSELVSSSS